MTHAMAARLTTTRTGGPSDDERDKLVEQITGWILTVLVAILVTRLGLFG